MNIILLGFMGTGKSTYGKLLAKTLGKPFVDTDALIEQKAGKSVAEIFRDESEEGFRRIERQVVEELSSRDDLVIATGGGVITHLPSMELLKRNGLTIGLIMEPAHLLRRIREQTKERPLIASKTDKEILDLYTKRLPHHFTCHVNVELRTDNRRQVVEQLVNVIEQQNLKKTHD